MVKCMSHYDVCIHTTYVYDKYWLDQSKKSLAAFHFHTQRGNIKISGDFFNR